MNKSSMVLGMVAVGVLMPKGYAADNAKPGTEVQPAPIELKWLSLKPQVRVIAGKDSNVSLTPGQKISSSFLQLKPEVKAEIKQKTHRYSAVLKSDLMRYDSTDQDDFSDNNFILSADNDWTSRFNTVASYDYKKGHDGRNSIEAGRAMNFWDTQAVRVLGHYGSKGAKGQIEVEGSRTEKEYLTDRANMGRLDVDTTLLAARYFHRIGADTRATFELRNTELDYPLDPSANSNERLYFVGVKWSATAKTTGAFKIGRLQKNFDAPGKDSDSDSTWEGMVTWQPLTYSMVQIMLNKTAADSAGVGDFLLTRTENIKWQHNWSSRMQSVVKFDHAANDYEGSARKDTLRTLGVALNYGLKRWMVIGTELKRVERDSTLDVNDYKRNVFMVNVDLSL